MALSKLQYRPGINRENTNYANEGGFFSCDKIRFRSGFAEKIGGWVNQSTNTFKGVCRSLFNYASLVGENLLGVGTNLKYYIENGGAYYDITPIASTVTLPNNPFATTNGAYLVTVTTTSAHNATIGTYVTFSGVSGSGVVNGVTLNGEFEIVSIPSSTTFTIIGAATATSTGSGGGAAATAQFQLAAGNSVYTTGVGYGVAPYGYGGYGSGTAVGIPLRIWTQDNFNEDLLIAPRQGAIYYWLKDTSSYARAITLSDAANGVTKFTTTASFGSGVTSITVTDATGITTGSVISGTGIPAGTYVTTAYAGGLTIPISSTTSAPSSGSYTFSYAGRHTPHTTMQVLTSSVGNFVFALGSNPYNPFDFSEQFDPLLVRWSDADNPYEWVPSAINQSGEIRVSNGSYLVTAVDNRQEILVWSDTALFSMQYIGPPYAWGLNLILDNISIISPKAAVTAGDGLTYWMGVDKFYAYSGRVDTLPCTVRQFIFGDLNKDQAYQIVSGVNEGFSEIWWFYPSSNSLINDRYVVYNYLDKVWYYGTLNRTAWLDSPLRSYPLASYSIQTSYLDTAINASQNTITLVNANTYPDSGTVTIDSEKIAYTGKTGNTLTGCTRGAESTTAASHLAYSTASFRIPNQVMLHEYQYDDRASGQPEPIEAYIESSDFDIGEGHNFGFVWRILPDLTFSGSTATNPQVMLTVKPRQNSGTNYGTADSPTVTRTSTYPVEQFTGQVYTRVRGRQMSFRIDSTELGVFWQLGAMRIDIRPDGRR